jgi:cytochrome c biogenesis protein CcmG/thiol:disulfide interchange protein DsbE
MPNPSPSRRIAWTGVAIGVALFLVFILFKAFGTNPHQVPFKLAGQPAPAFSLRRLDNGEKVNLASLRGKPIVMNFWATWCGPCRMEHPVLEWGHQKFGKDVHFLGVVFEDTEENARNFLASSPSTFPQLVDPSSGMSVDYGVAGVPETYFIDAQGKILSKYAMPIEPETLEAKVREIIQDSAQPSGAVSP